MDTSGLSSWLGIKTATGVTALSDRVTRWQDASGARAASWRFASVQAALRNSTAAAQLSTAFGELAELEAELGPILKPASELESETYGELLFLGEHTRGLNFIPFFLTLWSILRIYVLPGLSMLLPLAVVILPYFIIRFLMNVPMDRHTYWDILYKMLKGQMPTGGIGGSAAIATDASPAPTNPFKFLSQLAWAGGTLFQAVAQPYWNYKHLSKVDEIIVGKAGKIRQLRHLYDRITAIAASVGIEMVRNPLLAASSREALADVLTDPVPAHHCLRLLGQLEALTALATAPGICPARFSDTSPKFVDCFDFHVGTGGKPFTVDLGQQNHILLTGPNRGGKSTVLRAVAASVTLAHTYGCAFGTDCQLPYLARLDCCLKPDDLPGTKSRFEREVEFTAGTLVGDGPRLVLIDELYHSTNPPDALEACRYYCRRLWAKEGAYSMISTHIFQLVDEAEDGVQRLCCPAEDLGGGRIKFLYGLREGVCRVSSVHELMRGAFCG